MSDLEASCDDSDMDIENPEIDSQNKNATNAKVIEETGPEPASDDDKYKKYLVIKKDLNALKSIDLKEKINDAKNILVGCQSELITPVRSTGSVIKKLKYYTKLPESYLKPICSEESRNRSLTKAIQDTKPLPSNVLYFIYTDVRALFINYYVKIKKLPSNMKLLEKLKKTRNITFYKDLTIRSLVKNGLVDYHYFPSLNTYILAENPKLCYKRTLYLKRMHHYRSEKREIVYVAIKKIENELDGHESYLAIAASPTSGLISKCDAIDLNGDYQIKQWIQCDLLRHFVPGTVVVLTQPPMKTITPFSTREEMMEWLEQRDISFEKDDHKAILYNLVKVHKKRYKDKGYEEIFKSSGLEVVICPNEYETLDFFLSIYNNIRTYMVSTHLLFQNMLWTIDNLSDEEWMNMETMVIEEEIKMMMEDSEMERLVENILQMVKNGDVTQSNFPDVATKVDNFDMHIGDIIVD